MFIENGEVNHYQVTLPGVGLGLADPVPLGLRVHVHRFRLPGRSRDPTGQGVLTGPPGTPRTEPRSTPGTRVRPCVLSRSVSAVCSFDSSTPLTNPGTTTGVSEMVRPDPAKKGSSLACSAPRMPPTIVQSPRSALAASAASPSRLTWSIFTVPPRSTDSRSMVATG